MSALLLPLCFFQDFFDEQPQLKVSPMWFISLFQFAVYDILVKSTSHRLFFVGVSEALQDSTWLLGKNLHILFCHLPNCGLLLVPPTSCLPFGHMVTVAVRHLFCNYQVCVRFHTSGPPKTPEDTYIQQGSRKAPLFFLEVKVKHLLLYAPLLSKNSLQRADTLLAEARDHHRLGNAVCMRDRIKFPKHGLQEGPALCIAALVTYCFV